MLGFSAEKDALIAELEQAKPISDEARLRAEEANHAKSRFLATMSHELRTPLNAILGFSEIMRSEILGAAQNQTYKEYANDIHKSGQHLLNLINEMLDISQDRGRTLRAARGAGALADVAEDCQRLMRLRAESKRLEDRREVRAGFAEALGGRAGAPPDLPEPPLERDQVHAGGWNRDAQHRPAPPEAANS